MGRWDQGTLRGSVQIGSTIPSIPDPGPAFGQDGSTSPPPDDFNPFHLGRKPPRRRVGAQGPRMLGATTGSTQGAEHIKHDSGKGSVLDELGLQLGTSSAPGSSDSRTDPYADLLIQAGNEEDAAQQEDWNADHDDYHNEREHREAAARHRARESVLDQTYAKWQFTGVKLPGLDELGSGRGTAVATSIALARGRSAAGRRRVLDIGGAGRNATGITGPTSPGDAGPGGEGGSDPGSRTPNLPWWVGLGDPASGGTLR